MQNKIALHICYWSGTRAGKSLDDALLMTARSGADLVELSPAALIALAPEKRRALRQKIADMGMGVTINSGLLNAQNDVSSPDAAIRRAGLTHCRNMLEICRDMGSPYWSGLLHSAWCLRPDAENPQDDRRRTWDRSVRATRDVAKIAEEFGIALALEVVNRYEHFLFNTARDGIRFCEEVGSPLCKLLLDVFHMNIEEDNISDALRLAQARGMLQCLHLGESNRRIPTGGPSNIRWNEVRAAILDSGYSGPLVLEPLPFASSATAAKACLWRNVQNPDDLDALADAARAGVRFARGLLT